MSDAPPPIGESTRAPPESSLAKEFDEALASEGLSTRVRRVALELREPTRVATVAERANCTKEPARRELNELVERGMLIREADNPATYRRNEDYLDWRRDQRIKRMSRRERFERIEVLTEYNDQFAERFDAPSPEQVDLEAALRAADAEDVEWALTEWRSTQQRLDQLAAVIDADRSA